MSSSLPRKSYARIPVNIKLPNLIEVQLDSFERLKREGLGDLFHFADPPFGFLRHFWQFLLHLVIEKGLFA